MCSHDTAVQRHSSQTRSGNPDMRVHMTQYCNRILTQYTVDPGCPDLHVLTQHYGATGYSPNRADVGVQTHAITQHYSATGYSLHTVDRRVLTYTCSHNTATGYSLHTVDRRVQTYTCSHNTATGYSLHTVDRRVLTYTCPQNTTVQQDT